MPADAHHIAAAIAASGPGGVRIAQLMALRRDLFAPAVADALALPHATTAMPPDAAWAIVAKELGPAPMSRASDWIAVAEPNPLAWTGHGIVQGRETRLRIMLPDRAPSRATIVVATRLAMPLLDHAERDIARASLEQDLSRWIAADLDAPAQHLRLARWRRQALGRTGTIVARPIDDWASAHIVALAMLPGLPLPQLVALATTGDHATLDAHDIDAPVAARQLVEAALEQILLFGAVPIEPRLDHLAMLPGNRVARIDGGAAEPLSPALRSALPAIARAILSGDTALVAKRLAAMLLPGAMADPDALAEQLGRMVQQAGEGDADPVSMLDAALAAARNSDHRVPADMLALGRWLAATITAAIDIDPTVAIGETVRHFLLRRAIETAASLPDSVEAAQRMLALVAPIEALPGRIDRLLADATDRHYRLPVEQHRSPAERQRQAARARLVAVAIGWTGIALLLLVVRDWPAGLARGVMTALLWAGATTIAGVFPLLWRRSA